MHQRPERHEHGEVGERGQAEEAVVGGADQHAVEGVGDASRHEHDRPITTNAAGGPADHGAVGGEHAGDQGRARPARRRRPRRRTRSSAAPPGGRCRPPPGGRPAPSCSATSVWAGMASASRARAMRARTLTAIWCAASVGSSVRAAIDVVPMTTASIDAGAQQQVPPGRQQRTHLGPARSRRRATATMSADHDGEGQRRPAPGRSRSTTPTPARRGARPNTNTTSSTALRALDAISTIIGVR